MSGPVGSRLFRHGGGMPPVTLAEPSNRYLSSAECEEIAPLRARIRACGSLRAQFGRDPGTISRQLRRNVATRVAVSLRTSRALTVPRARSRSKRQGHVTADVVLS